MSSEEYSSDHEVFVGDITFEEMKKRLLPEKYRRTTGCLPNNEQVETSLKIIETHSAPNMLPKLGVVLPTMSKSESSPVLSPEVLSDVEIKPDDTFLMLEKMVSEMNVSQKLQDSNIDSTSESKVYFFIDQSEATCAKSAELKQEICINNPEIIIIPDENPISEENPRGTETGKELKTPHTSNLTYNITATCLSAKFKTPACEPKKSPMFKTPGKPMSAKKDFTPSKKYLNVRSPVAEYINKSPVVPLVKNVLSKRPLPGVSSIPKLVKSSKPSTANKENVKQGHEKQHFTNLPSLAYRSAKETKMIPLPPDNEKMPESQWAKEVASSIPRATVVKHIYRETNYAKKLFQEKQENSFADLSLKQADFSVCTETSAFNKPKKNVKKATGLTTHGRTQSINRK